MDNLFLLMILYLVYIALSFWLFNGNFLSPSIVFTSSLGGMLCLAYYTATTMGMLFAIGIETFSIFAFAGFLFILTEFCVYMFRTSTSPLSRACVNVAEAKHEPLIVNWQIQVFVTCLFAFSLFLAIIFVYMNTSGGTWADRMKEYRHVLRFPERIRYRFIFSQLYKVNFVIMDLFGYIMVYNLTICKVPVKQVLLYIIDSALYMVFAALFIGARQTAIEVLLFLMMIYVSLNMKPGGRQKIYRFIIKIIPVLIIVASLFTIAGEMVGRAKTKKSGFQNVAEYVCGGLYFFNRHINDPHTKVFGQSSFSFAYLIPQNMGLMPRFDTMVEGDFDIYGNTVTIFGRWYKDFGATGVFVMTIIVSLIYSLAFYYRLLYSNNIHTEHHFARIFYCQFMTALIWACYDDRFASLLTLQNVIFPIMVNILFWLLIKKKLKIF